MPKDRSDLPMGTVVNSTRFHARRTLTTFGLAAALFALVSTAVPGSAPAQSDEAIAIIVRTSSTIRAIGLAELRAVYGSGATAIQGVQIVPINLAREDPTRQRFDRAVLNLEPSDVGRYWVDSRIRSGLREPRIVPNVVTVVRVVATLPNGIGYVPASTAQTALRGTKTIGVIRGGTLAPR